MEEDYIRWLSFRKLRVQNLNFKDSSQLDWFFDLTSTFLHLRVIYINYLCLANHPSLLTVLFSCPHLQELALASCYDIRGILEKTEATSTSIKKLDFINRRELQEDSFLFLCSKLPNLEWVGLSQCPHLSEDGITYLSVHCPKICSLSLSQNASMTDAIIKNMIFCFQELRYLDISQCSKLTDLSIFYLIEVTKHLTYLDISHNVSMSNECINALVRELPEITEFKANGCLQILPNTFMHLGSSCIYMKTLHLGNCSPINDVALIRIAECCGDYLEDLDINYCYRITNSGLMSVAKCCRILKRINISNCSLIEEFGIVTLVENCADLEAIIMNGLDQISDDALIYVAEMIPGIKELHLSGCTLISDISIMGILVGCEELKIFDISENHEISTMSLMKLLSLNRRMRLRLLDISYCTNIDESISLQLKRKFPRLQVKYARSEYNYEEPETFQMPLLTMPSFNFSSNQAEFSSPSLLRRASMSLAGISLPTFDLGLSSVNFISEGSPAPETSSSISNSPQKRSSMSFTEMPSLSSIFGFGEFSEESNS